MRHPSELASQTLHGEIARRYRGFQKEVLGQGPSEVSAECADREVTIRFRPAVPAELSRLLAASPEDWSRNTALRLWRNFIQTHLGDLRMLLEPILRKRIERANFELGSNNEEGIILLALARIERDKKSD